MHTKNPTKSNKNENIHDITTCDAKFRTTNELICHDFVRTQAHQGKNETAFHNVHMR